MTATKIAHYDGGVPCMEITMPALNEKSIGALFAFYEVSCAVSGAMLGVNPFDQPVWKITKESICPYGKTWL